MITTYKAAADIDVLTSSFPIPGFGFVPAVDDDPGTERAKVLGDATADPRGGSRHQRHFVLKRGHTLDR